MRLRYLPEGGGYTVMAGERFLGRVRRSRRSYEHSNGRIYRYSEWSAYPPKGLGTSGLKTRAEAGRALIALAETA